MIPLCILLAPVALANILTLYVAWRRYMSTPTPAASTPSFWSALGSALKHDALTIAVPTIRAGLASFKAAQADPVKISLAIVQTQASLAQVAPSLAAAIEGDVIAALDAQLAKVAPATPAS